MSICNNPKCNKEYTSKYSSSKFCSRSCSNGYHNTITPKRKAKQKVCKYCNNTIISFHRRSVCNTCLKDGTHSKLTWAEKQEYIKNLSVLDIKQMSNTSQRPWTDRIRGYARRQYPTIGKVCKCGYSKHVEVCHIKPISSFSDDSLVKDINCGSNILYLCPNCHWEFDNL